MQPSVYLDETTKADRHHDMLVSTIKVFYTLVIAASPTDFISSLLIHLTMFMLFYNGAGGRRKDLMPKQITHTGVMERTQC